MKIFGTPVGLLAFTIAATAGCMLWSMAINDPREARFCLILGGLAVCAELIFGLCGMFSGKRDDTGHKDAGIDRTGQGRG